MKGNSTLRYITAATLFALATVAHAANDIGNAMTVPNDAIKRAEISYSQESVGIKAAPANYAMGGTLILLTGGLAEKRLRPALEKTSKEAPSSYIRSELVRAVRENLDRSRFPAIAKIDLTDTAIAARPSASPDCLHLSFEVYFTANMRSLQIGLHARVDADVPAGKSSPSFEQDLYYTVPVETAGVFFSPKQGSDYWQGQDATVVQRHIKEGADELIAMLNREVTRQPVKGRIPGRQIAWDDSQAGTYGVILDEVGDRVWLRLRSGRLASIPKPRK